MILTGSGVQCSHPWAFCPTLLERTPVRELLPVIFLILNFYEGQNTKAMD